MGKFGEQLLGMGLGAAESGLGAIMGMVLGKQNDKRQIEQQSKLTDMQTAAQREMIQYNKELELQMWKDTSYGAQKEQMRQAGLNPGLMYGMRS